MMNIFNETEEERNRKAHSLIQRALSYHYSGICVYPVYPEEPLDYNVSIYKRLRQPPMWEETWNGKTQDEEDIRKFKWKDAVNVYAVVGKNGIRVISLRDGSDRLLDTALYLLDLPFDYFWSCREYCYSGYNYIIVECPDDGIENFNSVSDGIELIWQGYFTLPDSHYPIFPYKQGKPLHVDKDKLLNCIETLRKASRNTSFELALMAERDKGKWKKQNNQVPYTPKIKKEKKPLLNRIVDNILGWFSLLGTLFAIGLAIFLFVMVTGWLFRGCQNTDTENYDYDPGIVRRH